MARGRSPVRGRSGVRRRHGRGRRHPAAALLGTDGGVAVRRGRRPGRLRRVAARGRGTSAPASDLARRRRLPRDGDRPARGRIRPAVPGRPGRSRAVRGHHRGGGGERIARRAGPLRGRVSRRPALGSTARDPGPLPVPAGDARLRSPSGAGGPCRLGGCTGVVRDRRSRGRDRRPPPDGRGARCQGPDLPGAVRPSDGGAPPRHRRGRRPGGRTPARDVRPGAARRIGGSRALGRTRARDEADLDPGAPLPRVRDPSGAGTTPVRHDGRSRRRDPHGAVRALGLGRVRRGHGPVPARSGTRRLGGGDPDDRLRAPRPVPVPARCDHRAPRGRDRRRHGSPAVLGPDGLDVAGVHACCGRVPDGGRTRAGGARRLPRVSGQPDRVGDRLPADGTSRWSTRTPGLLRSSSAADDTSPR